LFLFVLKSMFLLSLFLPYFFLHFSISTYVFKSSFFLQIHMFELLHYFVDLKKK
jgi:hypothetical protein